VSVSERVPITAGNVSQAAIDGGGSISSSAVQYHQGPSAETSAPASRLIVNSALVLRRAILPWLWRESELSN